MLIWYVHLYVRDSVNFSSCPEPVSVEVQVENPLHVILVLSDISLLWTFVPATRGPDSQQVISNEVTASVKVSNGDHLLRKKLQLIS